MNLRDERGMTLIELLVAMTIGLMVTGGIFTMLDTTVRLNTGVMSKTDAMQRGRLAMDIMTQELRSQVCLNTFTDPAVVGSGTTRTQITFYSDFSEANGDRAPEKRRLAYDPATRNVATTIWRSSRLKPLASDFPVNPAARQLRLENVSLQKDKDGNTIPFLRYYAYSTASGRALANEELVPNTSTGLTAAQAARVARIDITFIARPTGAKNDDNGVNLTDQIMVRHADPNLSVPDPKCI